MVIDARFNRDILLGRWRQCAALARQRWARLRGDPVLDTRSSRDFACGAIQARYGHSRALIELRVRELERGL
jgi:hypothetical protein